MTPGSYPTFRYVDVTIAGGQATTPAVDLGDRYSLVGIYTDSTFAGTAITFTAVQPPGSGTYVSVRKDDGSAKSVTVAASRYTALAPSEFAGIRFLKITSGTTQGSGPDVPTTLTLVTRCY